MTNQRPLNNKLEIKASKLHPHLDKKHQFFKKSLRDGTLNSSMLMQRRTKEALRQFVLALETSKLMHSRVFDQRSRFKSALKNNRETARMVNSSIKSEKVLEYGKANDDVDYDRKIRESIVFDFGDDYGNRDDTNLDTEFLYDNLDCYQTNNLVCDNRDNLCLTEIEDIKYSRDEIFRLSSLTKEDLEFF